jgi:molybdopterin/thiamine biosynthesis adenylyltransferase
VHEGGVTAIPQRVLVVGVGGLGCPVSLALARAGVPALTLADGDVVDVTNLHRQPWHHGADVGRLKVESAAEKLGRTFPALRLTRLPERVTAANAEALFRAHELVIDATDAVEAKFLLNDAAVLTGTPLVYGGVLRFEGLALRIDPGHGPCLRCLFETPPEDALTCAQAGVLGSMAGGGRRSAAPRARRPRLLVPHRAPAPAEGLRRLRCWRQARLARDRRSRMSDAVIDITREVCPMTYVRVKLALEALDDGQVLEVLLRGGEPLKNVPRSARDDGHEVVALEPLDDGRTRLTLRARH